MKFFSESRMHSSNEISGDVPWEFRAGECLPLEILKRHLGGCEDAVRIFRGCRLVQAGRIRIGRATQIDEAVFLHGGEGIEIGAYVHLATGSAILGGGSCRLGDFCGIGAGVRLVTGTEDIGGSGLTNPTVPSAFRTVRRGRIEVGSHAVVFTGSIILPGVTIGEGAVIATGSMVHHDLKPWAIYAGTPLTCVGNRPKGRILDWGRQVLAGNTTPS